jgi:hypothetical protein
LIVTNIFAWRATDPDDMKAAKDPVGRGNDAAILGAAREAAIVVCAWGNHGEHLERGGKVAAALRRSGVKLHYLKMNGAGHPSHPLYLPAKLDPVAWKPGSDPGFEIGV